MIDSGLFRRELRLNRIAGKGEPFLFDLVAISQLGFFYFRCFVNELGNKTVPGELVVSLTLHFRLFIFRMDARGGRFLIEQLPLQGRAQTR